MTLEQYFDELYAYARAQGLSRGAAMGYATLGYWTAHYGIGAPAITSGRRSREEQMRLIREWETYGSVGPNRLVTRPAVDSAHVDGEAFDVERSPALPYWQAWAPYAGLRSGVGFGDPIHFDTRT